MSIQPTPSGRSSRPGHLTEGTPAEISRRDTPAPRPAFTPGSDRVELSNAARELDSVAQAGEVPAGTLESGRLHDLLGRVSQGFYDRPEVRETVVRRIARDL